MSKSVSNSQFAKIKERVLIFDVRTKFERSILAKIENDYHCFYQNLISTPEKFIKSKNTTVILYCNAGNRSSLACNALTKQGYTQVFFLAHGVYGWQKWQHQK